MPASFEACRKRGGKVRTVSGPDKRLKLAEEEYMPVCMLEGKVFPGYKKTNHLSKAMGKKGASRQRGKDEAY